jgi:hypothetical protein
MILATENCAGLGVGPVDLDVMPTDVLCHDKVHSLSRHPFLSFIFNNLRKNENWRDY